MHLRVENIRAHDQCMSRAHSSVTEIRYGGAQNQANHQAVQVSLHIEGDVKIVQKCLEQRNGFMNAPYNHSHY